MTTDLISAARSQALFVSSLPTGPVPGRPQADAEIRAAVRARGGVRECLAVVATEYGEHPELAAARMRWALSVAQRLYPVRGA